MKNIFFLSAIILLLLSCGGPTENTMNVTGNVKGLKKGTLYLQHVPDSVLTTIDSLQIDGDGNFYFTTELESPEIFYLYLDKKDANDINDRITFFGEPGTITINTTWNTFDTKAKIEGSETQKKLEEYRQMMSKFNMKTLEIVRLANDPNKVLDSVQLDSMQRLSNRNLQRSYAFSLNYALNNKDSYIAPYIALNEVPDANVKYLDSIYGSLAPEVAESKYGKQLKTYLETLKK
ncbi:DUF4369 domain-containing protein [Zobellia galactanivorans]|uniref:DUF4369 domain-containing protein n=1 Tax=Zobellia galactanivorans (strain DSM 12802 / CCUG 47099 / CIP 106680 / NCIMB 13871 / Dsij) TaxID=63186 RepID=UPI001C070EDF|nr:DUF4369 domain-containing protein [Zobellia galactanivorans]MBU3026869.1 DUF4369 domain-containing protein [Zobellia galactanivorans]